MVTHLLESEGRRRSLGATVPSIVLHGALIALAVHATAHAALKRLPERPVLDTLVFRPTPDSKQQPSPVPRSRDAVSTPKEIDPVPVAIPALRSLSFTLDSISKPVIPIVSRGDFREGLAAESIGSAIRGVEGVALDARSVDRQAEALAGTRPPDYPDALRASGVQGAVVAQFVVDTAGRVEPGSIEVTSSTNPLFAQSVRSALIAARFRPAEVRGAPVRQLVQQSFSFVLR